MITLYQFGNSVCCQKVRIVLAEKHLDWGAVEVDLFKSEQYDPAYLKLNPKGVVPALVHDGRTLIESTLIAEYLDDAFPEPPLIPADAYARSRMRLWSKMVDEGLHEGVTEISFSAMFRERMKSMPEESRARRFRNIGDPRRRDRFTSTFEHGVGSPFVLYAVAAYERAFKMLEQSLEEGGPWILGADPTLADINLMPYVARLHYLGLLEVWIAERPRVAAWWRRVRDWPSFRAGVSDPFYPRSAYKPNSDPFEVDHTLGAAMMVRRDVAETTGGFDEAFHMYCEEIDWCWRIREAGWNIYTVPQAEIVHYGGESTSQVPAQSIINLWQSRMQLYRRHHKPAKVTLASKMVEVGMRRKAKSTTNPEIQKAYLKAAALWQSGRHVPLGNGSEPA